MVKHNTGRQLDKALFSVVISTLVFWSTTRSVSVLEQAYQGNQIIGMHPVVAVNYAEIPSVALAIPHSPPTRAPVLLLDKPEYIGITLHIFPCDLGGRIG